MLVPFTYLLLYSIVVIYAQCFSKTQRIAVSSLVPGSEGTMRQHQLKGLWVYWYPLSQSRIIPIEHTWLLLLITDQWVGSL